MTDFFKKNVQIDEQTAIEFLLGQFDQNKRSILLESCLHTFNTVFSPHDIYCKGAYCAMNVTRKELGLKENCKPGDIDIIVIPCSDKGYFFDCSMAFEIKVVRPKLGNPYRNANSLGIRQTKGLIESGFPLVSLMHVCMPEATQEQDCITTPLAKLRPKNDDKDSYEVPYDLEEIKWDPFPGFSADLQMRRLLCFDLPKYVGIDAVALNFFKGGTIGFTTSSQEFWHFKAGYFNPNKKKETIELVKKHFENCRNKYFELRV